MDWYQESDYVETVMNYKKEVQKIWPLSHCEWNDNLYHEVSGQGFYIHSGLGQSYL